MILFLLCIYIYNIQKVKRLLRADNEAVKCSWDLVTDDQEDHKNIQSMHHELGMPDSSEPGMSKKKHKSDRHGGANSDSQQIARDIDIFGEDLSTSEDEDDRHNINVELDETSRLSADDSRMSDYSMNESGSGHHMGQQDRLVTEFNKTMFQHSPKSNVSSAMGHHTPPQQRNYDRHESDDSEFSTPHMSQDSVNMRNAELRRQLNDLRNQRFQKELEISSIENQALRQRLQDSLDNIVRQILDREIELQELQSNE